MIDHRFAAQRADVAHEIAILLPAQLDLKDGTGQQAQLLEVQAKGIVLARFLLPFHHVQGRTDRLAETLVGGQIALRPLAQKFFLFLGRSDHVPFRQQETAVPVEDVEWDRLADQKFAGTDGNTKHLGSPLSRGHA